MTSQIWMSGHGVTARYPSGAALYSCYDYALSQVGTHPDMTLDAASNVKLPTANNHLLTGSFPEWVALASHK